MIVLGIMIFIVPKFEEIFADFDAEMPEVTTQLIRISTWLAGPLFGIKENQLIPGVISSCSSPSSSSWA